jgi:class 3 adenylate cyclase/predicted ATPase
MTFEEILDHVIAMLQRRGRVTYRTLQLQFQLDDDHLAALKDELLFAHPQVHDEAERGLVWTSDPGTAPPASAPVGIPAPAPLAYTPPYLAEKILTSRSALEGERKQVTVLFADIKDSTRLIEGLDPEAAQQLLDPALRLMMDAVHRFEGTVNQVLGDGVMALFGAPIAHEDHALRACYAALALQTAIRPYADEVRGTHGMLLQLRVGLNSGEVVVRAIGNDLHMDYSAVGQHTHLAARMEQLATPGTILLTAATGRLVAELVRVQALGAMPVKGLTAPVEAFELVGVTALRQRLQAAAARGLTRFVARQPELEALHQALTQAAAGRGQVVALVGEAGVGKSRLAYEFVHAHPTQGWRVLESASVSYGKATPYFPVLDLLKRYCHLEERDDPRTVRAKVTGQVLTLDETLQDTLPALLSLLEVLPEDSPFRSLDPPQRRQHMLQGLKRVLLRESQVQPLLLVFEDLHWIDAETQALLDSLVESLPTARLLLLVNYRPEYQHGWGSKTYYTQLRLDPLPPASAEEFLHALLGDDPSLVPLKQLLIARTEGNPFFLEESVRTLVETGALVGEPGAYRLARPLEGLQVPATVQAVLAARIDRLPPEDKRLLQTATVIGTEVPLPLLQAIADLPEAALYRGLAHLQTAEFLYETRLFPEPEYTFKHALTQEVAYNALLLERRRGLHERAGQAIEALFPSRLEEHYSVLAHHYNRSGNTMKAVEYLQLAGQQAVQQSAYAGAISHLTTAVELLKTLPDTLERTQRELMLLTTLSIPLIAIEGYAASAVEKTYAQARELCQQMGDTTQLFPVLWGLWNVYATRAELHTARELGGQILTLAQGIQDPARLMLAHRLLGDTFYHLGELLPTRAHLEQALALYDPQQHHALALLYGGEDPGVVALSFAAWTLWLLGYPAQARQRSQEALALAQELSHHYSLAFTLHFAAVLHQSCREVQVAQARTEALMVLSGEHGFLLWMATGTVLRGWALAEQGHGAEGIVQMSQGEAAYQATGAQIWRPYYLALLAEAYGKVRQTAQGLTVVDEAMAFVHNSEDRYYEAELYRLKGVLLLQQAIPETSQAEACFRQALEIASCQQAKSWELRAAMSLSRLWQRQGKRVEARGLLAPVYNWFTEGFDTADLQEAKALLEGLA